MVYSIPSVPSSQLFTQSPTDLILLDSLSHIAKNAQSIMASQPFPPRRFYLFTSPRTASNLLYKMLALEDQPHVLPHKREGYFFLPTIRPRMTLFSGAGKPISEWNEAERAVLKAKFQESFDDLQTHVESAAAQGKDVFVKEHAPWLVEPTAEARWVFGNGGVEEGPWMVETKTWHTHSKGNQTVLPDEFLKMWLPTFLIRHPALVFPSLYRTALDLQGAEVARTDLAQQKLEMTMHWIRSLYDWFVEQRDTSLRDGQVDHKLDWPIVIDADDIMLEPEVVRRYAAIVGLDPSKLKFEWEQVSEEDLAKMGRMEKRMRSTLVGSKGIVEGKTAMGLNLETEAEKWREEFGDMEGSKLESFVREAMADYEYLRERRLTVTG